MVISILAPVLSLTLAVIVLNTSVLVKLVAITFAVVIIIVVAGRIVLNRTFGTMVAFIMIIVIMDNEDSIVTSGWAEIDVFLCDERQRWQSKIDCEKWQRSGTYPMDQVCVCISCA